jgi:hypothetical protein
VDNSPADRCSSDSPPTKISDVPKIFQFIVILFSCIPVADADPRNASERPPPEAEVVVKIDLIEGRILELARPEGKYFKVVRLALDKTSDPKATVNLRELYITKTKYPVLDYKRQTDGEVLLFLFACPESAKVGDVIRVRNYRLIQEKKGKVNCSAKTDEVIVNPKGEQAVGGNGGQAR